jgi:hypothetical protein
MVPVFSQGSPPGAVRAVTSGIRLNKADKIEAVRAMNYRIVGHQVEVLGAIPKEGRR